MNRHPDSSPGIADGPFPVAHSSAAAQVMACDPLLRASTHSLPHFVSLSSLSYQINVVFFNVDE